MADDRPAAPPPPPRHRTVTWEDTAPTVARARELSGLDLLQSIGRGEFPWPPVQRLLGYEGGTFEDGKVVMVLPPAEYHYNPMGVVHGGVLSTVLDTVMACAVHSRLPKGTGYTTLDLNVHFVRAVTAETGPLTATGEVVHCGKRVATAKAEMRDAQGKLYAHATSTCMIL